MAEFEPVNCPWLLLCLRSKAYLCQAFITFRAVDPRCIGERCEQFVCWREVMNKHGWKTEETTNAVEHSRPQVTA